MTNDNNPAASGLPGPVEPLDLGPIKKRYEVSNMTSPGPWTFKKTEDESDEGGIFDADGVIICSFGDSEQYYPTAGCSPNESDLDLILNAQTDLAALVAEVERLRREVNTMAMVDYMQNMNEVGYITREFEPPYPDVWDGK